jgi:hypothetical protein
MMSLEQARRAQPELVLLEDEEALEVLNDTYGLVQLAFEKWLTEKVVPNI